MYAAGADYEPPAFDEQLTALDEALEREPKPVSFWLRELGVA